MEYDWPGNVRELENTVERLVVMSSGEVVAVNELPMDIRSQSLKARYSLHAKDALPSAIGDIERVQIIGALERTGWVQAKAARLLGISPRQIGYKIKKYDIRQSASS